MLPVETLSTDSRAHCIRDAKRLHFPYSDSKIARFGNLNQIHSTSLSYRKGQENTGFLKRVIRVLAILLREAPEDGNDFIWNCTPPQAAILPHTDYISQPLPWDHWLLGAPPEAFTHRFRCWLGSSLKCLPFVLRCTGISLPSALTRLNFRAFSEAATSILQHNFQLWIYIYSFWS